MKVTPITPITALRNNKKRKQTKDDFKKLLKDKPDGIA